MNRLTKCPKPANEPGDAVQAEIARRFHAIREAGTVGKLAEEFGVSRQTVYNCAQKYPPNRFDLGDGEVSA